MIPDWHYKALDSLWLLAVAEMPTDPMIFACEAHEISDYGRAIDSMVSEGLFRAFIETDDHHNQYELFGLTRRGLAEAERRNLGTKVMKDRSAQAEAAEVERTRDQYADNPMWGLL